MIKMKKLLLIIIMVICNFTFIFAEPQDKLKEEIDMLMESNRFLLEENNQLRKIIFEDAEITINGKKIKTSGLLEGFSLCYAKYIVLKEKMFSSGNYVEIENNDILKYKKVSQNIKELEVKLDSIEETNNSESIKDTKQSIGNIENLIIGICILLILLIFGTLVLIFVIKINEEKKETSKNLHRIFDIQEKLLKGNNELSKNEYEESKINRKAFDDLEKSIKQLETRTEKVLNYIYNSNDSSNSNSEKGSLSILDKNIEELELSVRTINCLKNCNIMTLKELIEKSADELAKTRRIGKKSMDEIKEFLSKHDLELKNIKE